MKMVCTLIIAAIAAFIAGTAISAPAPLSQNPTPKEGNRLIVLSSPRIHPLSPLGWGLTPGTKILVTTTTVSNPQSFTSLGSDKKLYKPVTTEDLKKMDLNKDNIITVRELRILPISIATVSKSKDNKLQFDIATRPRISEITYNKSRVTVVEKNGGKLHAKSVSIRTMTPKTSTSKSM